MTASTAMYAGYTVLAVILIFPFYIMLSRSFMAPEQYGAQVVPLFPTKFTLESWKTVIIQNKYFRSLLNTLIIVGFNIVAVPLASSFVAYGFSKCEFYGKKFWFALMLGTLLLPGIVTQVPLYVLFSKMNMLNTYYPLTIPNLLGGGAINVFLIRQFMKTVPKELDEAAVIDGAGALRRYAQLTLPLSTAVLIFIMVGVFVGNWGDYYGPLVYMSVVDAKKYTLAYAIFRSYNADNAYLSDEGVMMAAGVFMSVIPLIVFFIFQRRIVEGVMITGIKG